MDHPTADRGGRVLVATDFSRAADEAIRQADGWAKRRGARLGAVHVVARPLPWHPLFPQYQQRDVTDLVTLERELGERLADRIEELTGRDPATFEVDVTRGRTGLARLALGRIAEAVVRRARGSALAVRHG